MRFVFYRDGSVWAATQSFVTPSGHDVAKVLLLGEMKMTNKRRPCVTRRLPFGALNCHSEQPIRGIFLTDSHSANSTSSIGGEKNLTESNNDYEVRTENTGGADVHQCARCVQRPAVGLVYKPRQACRYSHTHTVYRIQIPCQHTLLRRSRWKWLNIEKFCWHYCRFLNCTF